LPVATALSDAMRATLARGVDDPGMWGAFVATVSGRAAIEATP
jgi:hypothetical protein